MAVETGMFTVHQTLGSVLCCNCGIPMAPNTANMCAKCLCSEMDITEGLQKHVIIIHCPKCDRYLQPPKTWIKAQLESKELLTFCLKRLKNLNKVRLVHAQFLWFEHHSKRLKVELRIQKEVHSGTIVEMAYKVEYVVQDQMCESCSRVQANPDQWVASVQLRQHVSHRRTFFCLEQLILRHDAASRAVRIKQMKNGIDFFFANRSHGERFVNFLGKVAPIRSCSAKQLTSHDTKSNYFNYKYTFSIEICPICREDLVCLPPKVSARLGNLGPLVICTKVSNSITLLDPSSMRHCFLDSDQYWRASSKSLRSSRDLVEYIVLNVEAVSSDVHVCGSKYVLADAEIARVTDYGTNDTRFFVRTHLGHILKPDDYALGYDLFGANISDIDMDRYKNLIVPDVILIKKSYEEKRQIKCGKPHMLKLKSLDMEVDNFAKANRVEEEEMNSEYKHFLRDLEDNPAPLEELLADLDLSDEDAEGEDDFMME